MGLFKSSSLKDEKLIKEAKKIADNIDSLVEAETFYTRVSSYVLGENATPDKIVEMAKEIESTKVEGKITEAIEKVEGTILKETNDGLTAVGDSLGLSKDQAQKFMGNSKSASVLLRALRDKLDEVADRSVRARAEERGFLSMIIYTIKKAIMWIIDRFNDLKDLVVDSVFDNPAGTSQSKRDYAYLQKRAMEYKTKGGF